MKERSPAGAERTARVIREGRSVARLNQQQLADHLGVSRATVAGWETGHSRPDLELIPALCKTLGMNLGSFFGVSGGMSREEKKLLLAFRGMELTDQQALLWQAEALAERRKAFRDEELRRAEQSNQHSEINADQRNALLQSELPGKVIQLYRSDLSAAAGMGATLDSEHGEKVWLFADDRTARADEIIMVNGRSMEPTFQDGDALLVEHTDHLREGEIGVFIVDGEGFVKEYRSDGLYSHNPDYGPMRFHEDSDVRCVGRVLGKVLEDQWPTEAQMELLEEMRL